MNEIDKINLIEDVETLLNITPNILREFMNVYNENLQTLTPTDNVVYISFSDWQKMDKNYIADLIYTVGTDDELVKLANTNNIPVTALITYQILNTAIQAFLSQYGKNLKILKVTNKTIHCMEMS